MLALLSSNASSIAFGHLSVSALFHRFGMPSTLSSGLFGPRGDYYYAVFVGVVLLLTIIGGIVFYRRAPPQ